MLKNVTHAKCVRCGAEYEAVPDLTTCKCGGILDIQYDYAYIRAHFTKANLAACRDYSMWRYRPLLPVEPDSPSTPLRVGWSPLYRADRLAAGLQKYGIVYNDEGQARISHGWGDELSYHVGGWNDPDGVARRSLTSNAFWVLSGLYDRDTGLRGVIEKDILALDSKYGLRTFEPHFEPDAKGVGRIPKLPAGTADNGAPYIHASVLDLTPDQFQHIGLITRERHFFPYTDCVLFPYSDPTDIKCPSLQT